MQHISQGITHPSKETIIGRRADIDKVPEVVYNRGLIIRRVSAKQESCGRFVKAMPEAIHIGSVADGVASANLFRQPVNCGSDRYDCGLVRAAMRFENGGHGVVVRR